MRRAFGRCAMALTVALSLCVFLANVALADTTITASENFQNTYKIYNLQSLGIGVSSPAVALDNSTGDFITRGPYVDVRSYASFSAAISGIGATATTLLIPNQQNVTANVTVPSNVTLWFLQGGSLNISTGVTVTINGHVSAELYQIFTWAGTGKVSFGTNSISQVYPQWWGAKGDASADATTAIQAAIDSLSFGGKVYFPAGRYWTTNTLRITHTSLRLVGTSPGETSGGSTIDANTSGKPGVAFLGVSYFGISDLEIRTASSDSANVLLVIARDSSTGGGQQSYFENLTLSGYPTTAFLYSIANEQATYVNLAIRENRSTDGGVTTRGIVGAPSDVLSIGSTFSPSVTIPANSNTVNFFYGTTLNMLSTNSNSVGIALYGSTTGQSSDWCFHGITGGAGEGSKAHVYVYIPANADLHQLSIIGARMEGITQSSIYVDGTSSSNVRDWTIDNYFAPEIATGPGIYCNALVYNSKLRAGIASASASVFNYDVVCSDIYATHNDVTFNSNTDCNRIYNPEGRTVTFAAESGGIHNRGNICYDWASGKGRLSAVGGLRIKHTNADWTAALDLEVYNSTNKFQLVNDGSLQFGHNGSQLMALTSAGLLRMFTGQLRMDLATGTAPMIVTSTTPVAHLTTVPATYNASGTQQTEAHVVRDSATLSSGLVTVSLSGSAAFTSSSTYTVTALQNSASTATEYYTVEYVSGSSFKIRSSNSGSTATVRYMAVGN